MRNSLVLVVAISAGCSLEPGFTEPAFNPIVPKNPLIALLASEASLFTMTKLGDDVTSPYRINSVVCNGLPTHTDVVDSLFFHGDGTFTRVYYNYGRMWQTLGVPEPVEMLGHHKWSIKGTVSGEGDVLMLTTTHWQQNDEPFSPFTGAYKVRSFTISGDQFSMPETLGTGCAGQRTPTTAVFTRSAE